MAGPLFVTIDWAKNGLFTDGGDDVTARVRGTSTFAYGRTQVTALAPIVSGQGSITLDNRSRDYSPRNASSPLFGKVKPARPVKVTRVVGGTTYTVFRGHTDDSPLDPDLDAKTVTVNLVDYLQDFQQNPISTTLFQGLRTGGAINAVLDAAGWTGGRDIDSGATIIPWWWADGKDAFTALQEIVASEGSPALLAVGVNGEIIFRDRQHRLVRSSSTTVQKVLRGTEATSEPRMLRGSSYSDGWANIVNNVSFSVDERQPTRDLTQVWADDADRTITVGASASQTVVVQSTDPFQGAVPPVAGVDYALLAGGVASITLSRTSGQSTAITITATGAGCTIQALALRAYAVPVARTYQVTATDSSSILDYGQRSIPSGQEPIWASLYDAQDIASMYVAQRAQPLPAFTARFVAQHTQTARLDAVLSLDLSDRVTVIEPETGLSNDFFVENIQHSVVSEAEHEILLGLEMAPPTPTSVFILGTSTLGGPDPLGY